MKHLYNLADANLPQPSIVTIGVFDGVHLGHQHLVRRLVNEARVSERLSVVITFYPHPDVLLRGLQGRYYLMSPDEKAEKLHALGVDYVVTLAFNDELRHIRAAEFVASLVARLKLSSLWVGADFAMGYKREGNVAFLQKQGDEKDFTLHVIGLIPDEERVISSTNIRTALQTGDVAQARDWLGRAYTTKGEVVHGEKRGRKIGFPTANVDVWNEQVIPANGVYAGWAYLNGERFMAVTNVGVRPTFAGDDVTVEAHLLDFERDIYGEQLEVTFETRLRAEQRFDGIEALVAQINRDVEAGREYLMQRA